MGSLHKRSVRILQGFNEAVIFTKRAPKRMHQTNPGEFLLATRWKLGLSQTELAKRVGISQQHIQLLESGRTDARLDTWRRVFDAMHCDLLLLPKPRRHLGEAKARRVLDGNE